MAFIRADGTYLQSSLILGLIDRYLLKASHDIKQFRLIQKNIQEIILLILGSLPSEIATTEIQNFLSSLDISMGKGLTQIEVHWVKEIPPIKNKHRCIIRDF